MLRKLRQEQKMTQAQLGEILGVTEFTVCRYENGQISMPVGAIRRAAAVFDACPAYFVDDTRCTLGQDWELVELFRRADRLSVAQRETVKLTLRALLDSLSERGHAGTQQPPPDRAGPPRT